LTRFFIHLALLDEARADFEAKEWCVSGAIGGCGVKLSVREVMQFAPLGQQARPPGRGSAPFGRSPEGW